MAATGFYSSLEIFETMRLLIALSFALLALFLPALVRAQCPGGSCPGPARPRPATIRPATPQYAYIQPAYRLIRTPRGWIYLRVQ